MEKEEDSNCAWGKRIATIAIGIAIVLVSFFGGYFTRQALLDDGMQVLLDVKNKAQQEYYLPITDDDFYDAAIQGINEFLLDRYSQYMNREEWKEAQAHGQGKYEGVGLAFSDAGDGMESLQIRRVAGNSPAENAGIQAGYYVVGHRKTTEDVMQPLSNYDALIDSLELYAEDETFYLYTKTSLQDSQVQQYQVAKRAYTENYVYYRTNAGAYRFTGKNYTAEAFGTALAQLSNDTAYIKLVQFNGNADKEFDSAMQMFKSEGKKNLVLDLRGNGGGYLNRMQEIAKYFCKNATDEKPIAVYAQYPHALTEYRTTGNLYNEYFDEDSKIYVLADSGTASASECLLGVMLDYGATTYENICLSMRNGLAKTYGKGIMQMTFTVSLLRGDALKLTTACVLWPSKNCIHDRGVLYADGTKTVEENPFGDTEIVQALQAFGV